MQNRIANTKTYRNHKQLDKINTRVRTDPAGFVAACEALYESTLAQIAGKILASPSNVVMLAGPSGSGKTTTARKLAEHLARSGVRTHTVELDDYFLPLDRSDLTIDWESPERLDITRLSDDLAALERGEEVLLPCFDFTTGMRTDEQIPLRVGHGEIAIFEGIHALNDAVCAASHPVTLYCSARMRVRDETHVIFRPEWMRFLRRGVRDGLFRNTALSHTLQRWPDVLQGEQAYIQPFKYRAQIMLDTSFDYEVNLLAPIALEEVEKLDRGALKGLRMGQLSETMKRFEPLDTRFVPEDSLLREFIGGCGV